MDKGDKMILAGVLGLVGLAVGGVAIGLAVAGAPPSPPPGPPGGEPLPYPEPAPSPAPAEPAPTGEPDPQELEALARELASEDHRYPVQVVIGWFTLEHARRSKLSVFRILTGKSGKYGHQKEGDEVRYAATSKDATPQTRDLARLILLGQVLPSQAIRSRGVSAWVELGGGGYTALKILQRQVHQSGASAGKLDFGGIWGRLAGTSWYLYNAHEPVIGQGVTDEALAAQVLAAVPEVPALDGDRPAVA